MAHAKLVAAQRNMSITPEYKWAPNRRVFICPVINNAGATHAFYLLFLVCSNRETCRLRPVTISSIFLSLPFFPVAHGKFAAECDLSVAPVYKWAPNSRVFICPLTNTGATNALNLPFLLVSSHRNRSLTSRGHIVNLFTFYDYFNTPTESLHRHATCPWRQYINKYGGTVVGLFVHLSIRGRQPRSTYPLLFVHRE